MGGILPRLPAYILYAQIDAFVAPLSTADTRVVESEQGAHRGSLKKAPGPYANIPGKDSKWQRHRPAMCLEIPRRHHRAGFRKSPVPKGQHLMSTGPVEEQSPSRSLNWCESSAPEGTPMPGFSATAIIGDSATDHDPGLEIVEHHDDGRNTKLPGTQCLVAPTAPDKSLSWADGLLRDAGYHRTSSWEWVGSDFGRQPCSYTAEIQPLP